MENQQNILSGIRPCDLSRPYIFISYSSLDSALVWNDVLEFQKRGYNIWLDEINLDKTKSSWKEDAFRAVERMNCELVVFYVSRNSLRSTACLNELNATLSEKSRACHYGPIKFIAVDVEPIGDIVQFGQEVFNLIRNCRLQEDEKESQAVALSGFINTFFNSNNEKVRIHAKNEKGRKLDYYSDIISSFPITAKIFSPQFEASNDEKANSIGSDYFKGKRKEKTKNKTNQSIDQYDKYSKLVSYLNAGVNPDECKEMIDDLIHLEPDEVNGKLLEDLLLLESDAIDEFDELASWLQAKANQERNKTSSLKKKK